MSFGNESEPFYKELKDSGIKVHLVNGNLLQRVIKILSILREFECVHIHSPAVIRAFIFVFPVLYAKKVLYTMHGEHQASLFGMKFAHRLANGYIDQKFAVSTRVKDGVQSRYNWSSDSVTVIANGIPVSQTQRDKHQRHKSIQFGMVARLVELKQIDQVILQMNSASSPSNTHLHVFGEGPLKSDLHLLVERLQLESTVSLHGREMDPDKIYSAFDCLIINSTTEGLPMVMLEAMSYGIPVISTAVGAIPELINQGKFGNLIGVGDSRALGEAMAKMCQDEKAYLEMSDNAFEFVKKNFALDFVSGKYLAAFMGESKIGQ
jgi:glycosyltransferase involved in cell wall biosynthesis